MKSAPHCFPSLPHTEYINFVILYIFSLNVIISLNILKFRHRGWHNSVEILNCVSKLCVYNTNLCQFPKLCDGWWTLKKMSQINDRQPSDTAGRQAPTHDRLTTDARPTHDRLTTGSRPAGCHHDRQDVIHPFLTTDTRLTHD